MKASYSRHYRETAEGHIFLDKEGACTIALTGAASMSQQELDYYGEICAKALRRARLPDLSWEDPAIDRA